MSSGTRVDLAYVAETTQGETPSSPGMKELRATVRNINANKTALQSEEVKAHRQVMDQRHGFNSVAGNIDSELSFGDYDDMLEAALGGTWGTNAGVQLLKVGNTLRTFTIERRFNDIDKFQVFRGVAINEMAVSVQPDSIVSLSLGVVGMGFDAMAGATLGAPTASPGNNPFSAFSGEITEGGAVIGYITGIDFTVTNNRSVNPVIGSKIAQGVDEGQVEISGTVTARFPDAVLYDKFVNETDTKLKIRLDDDAGSDFIEFEFPRVKYNGAEIDPPQTGPVIQSLPFVGLYDAIEETAIVIRRSN